MTRLRLSPVLAWGLGSGAVLAEGAAPGGQPAPYASAKTCSECHPAIHGYWSESEHARSATSPAFLEALRAAVDKAPDKDAVRDGCVIVPRPDRPRDGRSAPRAGGDP